MNTPLRRPRFESSGYAWFPRVIYGAVFVALAIFLCRLGSAPWRLAATHWPIVVTVALVSTVGLYVQARSFSAVASSTPVPVIMELVNIWAGSAAVSVIAPFFAGFATRTMLLVRQGMRVPDCIAASLRQIWMGLEYALLLAALSLPFTGLQLSPALGGICLCTWACLVVLRVWATRRDIVIPYLPRLGKFIGALATPVMPRAHSWFALQIFAMSAVYYLGFNGLGTALGLIEAVALSSATVLLSLIAFVPNGLGVTDVMWVWVAAQGGASLETAVAIAIIIRLGHLFAAVALHLTLLACLRIKSDSV